MNILFLTTHLNTGGITSYLFVLAKGLIEQGHEVFVVSSGGNMEEDFLSVGAKVIDLNIKTKSELSPKLYFLINPLKKIIKDNDIDVIHAQTRVTQVLAQIVSFKSNIPYVSTCHGYFKNRLSRKLFSCWGEKVIAISEAVQRHLEDDFSFEKNRIVLIRSGIDLEKFPLIDEKVKLNYRRKYDVKDVFIVGTMARLSDVKGQDILLEALPKIKKVISDVKVFFIGTGKFKSKLIQMVEELDIVDDVVFLPVVNDPKEGLSMLDVFVAPSRQEGLGLSIMEAQASGLPVVASNVGGIPSLIEDGKTGFLFKSESPEDLARTMIAVLNHSNRRKEVGLVARDFAFKNYSSKKMVEKTIDLYKSLIEGYE